MRMTTMDWVLYTLVAIGGINWGLIGFFDFNLVAELFESETIQRIIYGAVGVATLVLTFTLSMNNNRTIRMD